MLRVAGVNLLSLTAGPSAPVWSTEIDGLYLFVCIRTDVLRSTVMWTPIRNAVERITVYPMEVLNHSDCKKTSIFSFTPVEH